MTERHGRIATLLVSPWGVLLGALTALTLAAAPPYPSLESNRTPGPAPLATYNGLDPNAASESIVGGTLLEPGAGWVSFTWYGDGPALDREGPFWIETDFPVTLRLTDDFCTGDRFRIYDGGVELAETFDTTTGPGAIRGPDAAFRDAAWTSGIYSLEAGRHELRVQAADNPWKMGRGYLRIDREFTLATLASEDLSETFGPVRGADHFRTTATIALGEDSDGILPNFEEVVISFGRYLEVIPAGSFVCNEIDCEYVSVGPGITRAVLRTTGFHFEADRIQLCPGSNPLVVGVWIGNDGGSMRFRCQGRLHD